MRRVRKGADPATVVGTLADEAAECRYLLTLCEAVRNRALFIQERGTKVAQKIYRTYETEGKTDKTLERWEKASRNSQASAEKVYRRAEKYQKAAEEGAHGGQHKERAESVHDKQLRKYEEQLQAANEAVAKIRAKHSAMPACF
jgi:biopolymer transport protein ExbB/TolQ